MVWAKHDPAHDIGPQMADLRRTRSVIEEQPGRQARRERLRRLEWDAKLNISECRFRSAGSSLVKIKHEVRHINDFYTTNLINKDDHKLQTINPFAPNPLPPFM